MVLAQINLGRSFRRKGRSEEWHTRDSEGHFKDEDFKKGEEHLKDAISRLEQWGKDRERYYEVEAYDELGCLYRDWVAALYDHEQERRTAKLMPYLEKGVENLEHARSMLEDNGIVPEWNALQFVDASEDLARLFYWKAVVDSGRANEWWQQAMELLQEATSIIGQYIDPQEESWFLTGKIEHQYARIAQEQGETEWKEKHQAEAQKCWASAAQHQAGAQKCWANAAQHFARAAGLLEKYSPYLPELNKTVSGACNWLVKPGVREDVRRWIGEMKNTLCEESLTSNRLKDWIDDVVAPQVDVGWS